MGARWGWGGGGGGNWVLEGKVHPALRTGPHNTSWALNASSLLGITTSLLTFKLSSLILNVKRQGKGGKGGGGGGEVLEGKVHPALKTGPHNTPWALNATSLLGITTSLLTFKLSSLNLTVKCKGTGERGEGARGVGGGGEYWRRRFTQPSNQAHTTLPGLLMLPPCWE